MTSGNDSSNLNRSPSVRENRIAERRNYTDACVEKGADGEGIRRGTNRIYSELFNSKPAGSRDEWTEQQQKEVTIAENFAASHVRSLPTPSEGTNQATANQRVVEQSGAGAKNAREYCDDQKENGNYYTRLYHGSMSDDEFQTGFTLEPRSQSGEREYRGTFSKDMKRLLWVIAGIVGWLLLHKLLVR
jgi:hypothetical protein